MTGNAPTREAWQELHGLIIRVKDMGPWTWMTENNVFGVQDPHTDEIGFVSVMGMRGEHYAIAVYRGAQGLYGFRDMYDADPSHPSVSVEEALERLVGIPHLQGAWENREELDRLDRDLLRDLGLKCRGPKAWPMFRSYRPGFVPWFLEADEASLMRHALEQTLDVAPRYREDRSLLSTSHDESCLVLVPRQEGPSLVWEDSHVRVPRPTPPPISIALDAQEIASLKGLSRSTRTLEIDLFMLPSPVEEKGDRPVYPYLLLVVDAQSSFILGTEMTTADPTLEAMWEGTPAKALHVLSKAGLLPAEVRVRSPLLEGLLKPLAKRLGFKLTRARSLSALESVKRALLGHLG